MNGEGTLAGAAGPLHGIRVVDLTAARAGPACVRILADLGADVIQVTRPASIAPAVTMPNFDAENLHRNKRSIAVDLQKEEGRSVFFRLAEAADVVVENYRPDVKHRLGIDYATVAARNGRVVYGSISGFGQEGPYVRRPGLDQIIQGLGGLMSITGEPGSGPWRVGVAISDLAAGTFLANGIMAALYERERSGKGQWVQTSLLEAMISLLDFQATRWLIGGEVAGQAGNDHPTMFPTGLFETADDPINIAATSDRMFRDFLQVIDETELAADERFGNAAARGRNRAALRAACEGKLRMQPAQHWIEALNEAGVPCGPVLSIDQVFADPQVEFLGMAQEVDGLNLVRSPLGFSRTPASLRKRASRPGEHTLAVLRELGLDSGEIDALVAGGAVGAS